MTSVLVFPDGRRVDLDADLVVGRAPTAPEASPSARPVSLAAPTVSKTHALVGHDAQGVWLVDLHSSNGSEVLADSGESQRAVPGERLLIPSGSHIRLGTDTIITIDAGTEAVEDDLDRTIVIRPAEPPPVLAAAAPPLPPSPAPSSPPPPVAAPPPPKQPGAAEPTTTFAPGNPQPTAPSQPPPPSPPHSYGHAPFVGVPPQSTRPESGRSVAHIIGATIILVWAAVGFATLRGWVPDAFFDTVDGRLADFFFIPSQIFLEFFEFFALITLPDSLSFLSRGADIGPPLAIVTAIIALVLPKRAVRWILVVLVAIPMVLLVGFIVTVISESFDFFVEDVDRYIPWFVLPGIGSVLLLWPSRRATPDPVPAPSPGHDVFYAPGQPPAPPSAGQGSPPFS